MRVVNRALGEWLRECRERRRRGRTRLAMRLGIDRTTVYSVERGRWYPSMDLLLRWTALLGVDLIAVLRAIK